MESPKTYCISYINRKLLSKLETDLLKSALDIEVVIPTVNVLTKKFKGKEHYDEVPLMLNYGFVRVPNEQISNLEYFRAIAEKINCISGFMKLRGSATVTVATATVDEVNKVVSSGKRMSIYSGMDFDTKEGRDHIRKMYEPHTEDGKYVEGKVITLKGYPFDGVEAQVLKIKFSKQEVEVLLQLGMNGNTVAQPATISFHNLFYTIYDDMDEADNMKEKALEDITSNYKNPELVLDKILHKAYGQED